MTDRVQAKFDRVAATYESRYDRPRTILDFEKVRRLELSRKHIGDLDPESVLELGCGGGRALWDLAQRHSGRLLVGSDISDGMLRKARSKTRNRVRLVRSSAEGLAFRQNTFDLVFALGVVDYLQEPQRCFREVWRVLKPGGHLLFTFPNRVCLNRKLRAAYQSLRARARSAWHSSNRSKKCLTEPRRLEEVTGMLVEAGFSLVGHRYFTYGNGALTLPWSRAVSRMMEDWLHPSALSRYLAWSGLCLARKNVEATSRPALVPDLRTRHRTKNRTSLGIPAKTRAEAL